MPKKFKKIRSKLSLLRDYFYVQVKGIPNFNKSQYWSLEKLEKFQNKRLKKIIVYAYNNIPGYRKKFDLAGIKPSDIQSKNDLHKIPITTREELQDNKCFVNKKRIFETLFTGGSTGSPLKYYDSKESAIVRMNAHYRGWLWNGYKPGKRLAIISSAQGIVTGKNILNLIGDSTEKDLNENAEALINFKPQHIRGYAGSIYVMAKHCLENNLQIKDVESINTISENLYDYQREMMEKVFNCKVFDEYCCNDGGASAWECRKHTNLHYVMERAIIEKKSGMMIVTDLWNKAMPFIRYQNGDAVTFVDKQCACKRQLPLIKVKGRNNDMIISKRGIISPTFLMHHGIGLTSIDKKKVNFKSGIRSVQYVQKPGYVLEINIVKNSWCSEDEIEKFKRRIFELTHGMKQIITFVNEIPTTKKGKRSFIINEDKKLLKKRGYL